MIKYPKPHRVAVDVLNVVTGEVQRFKSLCSCAKCFSMSQSAIYYRTLTGRVYDDLKFIRVTELQ